MAGKTYRKEHLNEISFPLGGIGTGSIGLAGNGSLTDWEIYNNANKNSEVLYSHFAIKAERNGELLDARVLTGDCTKNYCGRSGINFGNGMSNWTLTGFPHFRDCEFTGEYPIAKIRMKEPLFPGSVTLTAFNPFIPLNADDSGIPAAFFSYAVKNTTKEPVEYTMSACFRNPRGNSVNTSISEDGFSAIHMTSTDNKENDPAFRELTVATDATGETAFQEYWCRGMWYNGIETYWANFTAPSMPNPRHYDDPGSEDMASMYVRKTARPDETVTFRFVVSWSSPYFINYWSPYKEKDEHGEEHDVVMRNYYSYKFKDSLESARYSISKWDRLYTSTMKFHNALFSSSLPGEVLDAVSAANSVLKTATCMRIGEKGDFYGFEGLQEHSGSCDGTCGHVWTYVYATCFLFPELERNLREIDYTYNQTKDGAVIFRSSIPYGREPVTNRACFDGQMGGVIKTYREWKISGNDEWLKSIWPSVKKALEFAWSDKNRDMWDKDKDGVAEGRQHHTLDTELFGPSSWLEGFYLGALRAASEMARYLGENEAAEEYDRLFENGKAWTDKNLFNGEYYYQKVDLQDKVMLAGYCKDNPSIFGTDAMDEYWNEETGEINYQIGEGCEIDQMVAQWHADILHLGDLYDAKQIDTALMSLYKNNYKESMRNEYNPYRVFCVNDESGTIMCSFPKEHRRPAIPILTSKETMHGFEYSFAGLLFSRGFIDEGLKVVNAVRSRYDGKKRNPWNEMECGSNYSRSMSSYSFLPILSGMKFDMTRGLIGFSPIINQNNFKCFWSLGTGWGSVKIDADSTTLSLSEGSIRLNEFTCPGITAGARVYVDGRQMDAVCEDGRATFSSPVTVKKILKIRNAQ